LTWLIAEDKEDFRSVMSMMCSVWVHPTLIFLDNNQACSWLRAASSGSCRGELPELALLDIRMSGPTGNQMAARICQFDALKHIPVIIMIAYSLSDSGMHHVMTACGASDLVHKLLPDMDKLNVKPHTILDATRAASI
jgi:CheY-like chemotaxis protein